MEEETTVGSPLYQIAFLNAFRLVLNAKISGFSARWLTMCKHLKVEFT